MLPVKAPENNVGLMGKAKGKKAPLTLEKRGNQAIILELTNASKYIAFLHF